MEEVNNIYEIINQHKQSLVDLSAVLEKQINNNQVEITSNVIKGFTLNPTKFMKSIENSGNMRVINEQFEAIKKIIDLYDGLLAIQKKDESE